MKRRNYIKRSLAASAALFATAITTTTALGGSAKERLQHRLSRRDLIPDARWSGNVKFMMENVLARTDYCGYTHALQVEMQAHAYCKLQGVFDHRNIAACFDEYLEFWRAGITTCGTIPPESIQG